jgi:hypothetical protein
MAGVGVVGKTRCRTFCFVSGTITFEEAVNLEVPNSESGADSSYKTR